MSPAGINYESFKENLRQGRSGEGAISGFDPSSFPVKRAYEVKGFNPKNFGTQHMDPFIQYAVGATSEALAKANFDTTSVDPFQIGIAVSSSKGGVHTIDRFKERFEKNRSAILGARIYTNTVPNFAAQWIARRWKLKGPAKCYIAACATGTVAIAEGARMVSEGVVDYCIAGASDASIVPLMLAGYKNMKALSQNKMKPFDKTRDGFMVGEGAGIVFLESYESAKKRGAKIYAEFLGASSGQDIFHPLKFDHEGNTLSRMLESLAKKSEVKVAEDLDYINVHGTATLEGDVYETEQLKKAFGDEAEKISLSSTKSTTGHMLGASGAVEAIACIAAMEDGFIPPTLNLETVEPACDLDYTPLKAKEKKIEKTFSYSLGFGGHAAALALGKTND